MPKSSFHRGRQKVLRWCLRSLLHTLRMILRAIPMRLGIRMGGGVGYLAYTILKKERNKAIKNFETAMGELYSAKEGLEIIRRSFGNLGKSAVELLYLDRLTQNDMAHLVTLEGEEHLRKALEQNRGVLFLSGHIGNWEFVGAGASVRFPNFGVMAAPMYDPKVEEVIVQIRKRHRIETFVRDQRSALRRLFMILKNGGIVAMLIDQDTKVDGVFVPFFGREAYTPSGPAILAARTGAAVVIGFAIRLSDNRHKLIIHGPIDLVKTGDPSEDTRLNTEKFTRYVEECIRVYPDQWIWMHDRWKTVKGR